MSKNDYKMDENDIPKGFVKSIYFKQRGYINVFFRAIYFSFLRRILRKKIIKFKTTYNTNYNIFHWDFPAAFSIFVSNNLLEWGIEYFFIYTLKNRQRNVFLDVGCHTGYFTCLFNNHFKKIIGFEPSLKCVEVLELLKKEYNNFIYYNCFLGNVNKSVISKQYDNGWAFVQENITQAKSLQLQYSKFHKEKKLDQKKIEMKTIDKIISNNHVSEKISAIKIDVDGLDLDVLKGAFQVIKRDRPSIMIENDSKELLSLMREINYKVFTIACNVEKPYNLCLTEITNDGSKFWQTNSVCVPEEYVPKDLYTKEIKGNFLFGLNKKVILEKFS